MRLSLKLEDHFLESLVRRYDDDVTEFVDQDEDGSPIYLAKFLEAPPAGEIRAILEASFWASLIKEEGRFHEFKLLFAQPDDIEGAVFDKPLPLCPEHIAKLAPALPPPAQICICSGKIAWRKIATHFIFGGLPGHPSRICGPNQGWRSK